jgi:hypothetical protein
MNETTHGNRKDLVLSIYQDIRTGNDTYYVPVIDTGTNPTIEDVFEGTERLYIFQNGLYFISSTVIDIYKLLFPKNIRFVSVDEAQFNTLLERICMVYLPTKPIALVKEEQTFVVERSEVIVSWIKKNVKKRKTTSNLKKIEYIDKNGMLPKGTSVTPVKKKKSFLEILMLGIILIPIILSKVLFLYVAYLFSFDILLLSGLVGFGVAALVFLILSTMGDVVTQTILKYICKTI